MKAILMSDMIVIKSQAKSVLLVLAVWLGITIFNKSGLFFSALSIVYAMMLPLTCIATYEKSRFDRYLFTAPISRTSAAMGHYVFSIICAFCLSTIGFIASVALGMSVQEAVFSCSACFCIGIVMVSVILPVIYKYGTERGPTHNDGSFRSVPAGVRVAAERFGHQHGQPGGCTVAFAAADGCGVCR